MAKRAALICAFALVGCGSTTPILKPTPRPDAHRANVKQPVEGDEPSSLPTKCIPAHFYPDGKVPPIFYQYPQRSEWKRYAACVGAEVRRDGHPRLATAASFPKVGTCYSTRVKWRGGRFSENPADANGSAISFDNGIELVEYSVIAGVVHSRVGDPMQVCVADLPKDCPADDLRGIGYRARNLRTGETWKMGNSQHICRGA